MISKQHQQEGVNQTPEKQASQGYIHGNSQKVSKENVLTDFQKYKIGAGKNPNF